MKPTCINPDFAQRPTNDRPPYSGVISVASRFQRKQSMYHLILTIALVCICDSNLSAQIWRVVGSPGILRRDDDQHVDSVKQQRRAICGIYRRGEWQSGFCDDIQRQRKISFRINVGPAGGFWPGAVMYTSIAIDTCGNIYVSYMDLADSNKATVMTYNGTGWVPLGVAGFSPGHADEISLAIDRTCTPYVFFADSADSGKAMVMKYTGSSWEMVGNAGFTTFIQYHPTGIAINNEGVPYVGLHGRLDT